MSSESRTPEREAQPHAAREAAIRDLSRDAVVTIDRQGRVVEFNSAAEALFDYKRNQALGRVVLELVLAPQVRARVEAGLAQYAATGESDLFGKRLDTIAMRADGTEFPVEVAMAPINLGERSLVTLYLTDLTARKQAERELKRYQDRMRSLMAELLVVEERERRQLAIDLHDGLSQTIALARMKLASLRQALHGQQSAAIDELQQLIDQANQSARSITFELSPPVLHDFGLEPALQWLVENIHARYGIPIELENDGQPKSTDEITRVILFRSIRELLINAAKHAGARRIRVRFERAENFVQAAVEDDGVGMQPETSFVKGTGLFSIRERLNHVGGSMLIESVPGRGTKISLNAPLSNGNPQRAEESL